MLRFILVMREQEVEETQGNSSGFPTRFIEQICKKKKLELNLNLSTREGTTNCLDKAAPLRDIPTMTIGIFKHLLLKQ